MTFAEGFSYHNGELHCGEVSIKEITYAVGTPVYIYNLDAIVARYHAHTEAFSQFRHLTCYAVKANSNIAVLQALARAGSGFDVNSRGELYRCMRAGADASSISMTGVGKTKGDIVDALNAGVARFNVESASECRLISDIAEDRGFAAEVLLRLNPDIETDTHPYISTAEASHKFGLSASDIRTLASQEGWLPGLRIAGLSFHLGSQILSAAPYKEALRLLLKVLDDIIPLLPVRPTIIDIGGGLGIPYTDRHSELHPRTVAMAVEDELGSRIDELTLITEPGRSLVANAGALVSTIEHVKPSALRTFLVLDAGMNDFLRPALYQARHSIVPLLEHRDEELEEFDIVGPVCESSDTFAIRYPLPVELCSGDQVALLSAGAYGSSMSSMYNSRPLAAEVVVTEGNWFVARERQSLDDMLQGERLL